MIGLGFTVGSSAKKHEKKVAKLYVVGISLNSFFFCNKNSTCCMTFNQVAMHALHFIRLLPMHSWQQPYKRFHLRYHRTVPSLYYLMV